MLLRAVHLVDPASPHHLQTVDLRIDADGTIAEIGKDLTSEGEDVIDLPADTHCAPGFVDIGAYLGEPGHEEREDIESLRAAALAGGYTTVAVLPTSTPVRQRVADLAYLTRTNAGAAVELLPLASLSHDGHGNDLTEMADLATAGAVAFTDGVGRPVSGSLLRRGLEYAKTFDGRLLVTPHDGSLSEEGQIHEGAVSVQLGLPGLPELCEIIPLSRDLELLRYTEGQLIVHLLSSAGGVDLLRRARDTGAYAGGEGGVGERVESLYATVSAHHLSFTVDELTGFDSNFKVLPPLRATSDRSHLRAAAQDGTIDAVVSNHHARHGEEKDLEFPYTAFGARGLETAFRQCLALVAAEELELARAVELFTSGPRRVLGLPENTIAPGRPASLTLFTTEPPRPFTAADLPLRAKTTNNPALNRDLPGRILGTVTNGRFHPAP